MPNTAIDGFNRTKEGPWSSPGCQPLTWIGLYPALENSGRNPFLREHLPAEDIRPERASIATCYAYPFGIATVTIAISGAAVWVPAWFLWVLAVTFLFFAFRGFRRIDAAWAKALQRYNES
jgi:hypothetical protein